MKLEAGNSKLAKQDSRPVKDFTDLEVWRLARELRQKVYVISKRFPAEEKYVLTAQLRRAAISITANLAEGFGRYSYQENIQFCRQARGSVHEVRDHLIAALDAGYFSLEEWQPLVELAQSVTKLINGYIRSTRARQAATSAK